MASEEENKVYEVAMDNYDKLVNVMPTEEILRKLLPKRVISISDKQVIMSEKSDVLRAECLLEKYVLNRAEAGDNGPVLAVFDAMRESGKCDDLVRKIYNELGMELPPSKGGYGEANVLLLVLGVVVDVRGHGVSLSSLLVCC